MSTWADREISCVFCATSFVVRVASGLHITRLPAVREQILRGELHRFECPSCRRTLEVRLPIIYTDFQRGHWIEVHPDDEIATWPELGPACEQRFQRTVERGASILREGIPAFKVRLVFGYNELREKVTLWDAGLDDVDVECLKLVALRSDVSMLGFDDRFFVGAVSGDRLHLERQRPGADTRPFTLIASSDRLRSARADVIPAFEHAFAGPFVSINRVIGRYAVT